MAFKRSALPLPSRISLTALFFLAFAIAVPVSGQTKIIVNGLGGVPVQIPNAQIKGNPYGRAAARPSSKPPVKKSSSKKPPSKSTAKPGSKTAKKGATKKGATITRPNDPKVPANPQELEVKPGKDGKIRFKFRGQKWPDVMDFVAKLSQMSLDWQELPSDFLNLTTQRGHTVEEVRDLVNRHLLSRGFTMLVDTRYMTIGVVKIDKLNVGLVPRLRPSDLATRLPSEFVRVIFPLKTLVASQISKEVQPSMSTNGKLTVLNATNRLDVTDTVINLREIHRMLEEEEGGKKGGMREFPLRYTKAADLKTKVMEFIGGSSGSSSPSSSRSRYSSSSAARQLQAMAQQQAMLMKQMQARARSSSSRSSRSSAASSPAPPPKPVRILANAQNNSLLVSAPPDKMLLIDEVITMLDVPSAAARMSVTDYMERVEVFRLVALDPQKLVESLNTMGGLHPTTRLTAHESEKAIVVDGPKVDRLTVKAIIERLDGSNRHFEVIELKRERANDVAGSINLIMGTEKKDNSRRSYDYDYGYFGGYSSRNRNKKSEDKFKVEPDVRRNRLLVWANDSELREVYALLEKLGETGRGGINLSTVRVLEMRGDSDADAFLMKLKKEWEQMAPGSKLILPEPLPKPKKVETTKKEKSKSGEKADGKAKKTPVGPAKPATSTTLRQGQGSSQYFVNASSRNQAEEKSALAKERTTTPIKQSSKSAAQPPGNGAAAPPRNQPPAPIRITRGPDGRLILAGADPRLLDMLESFMEKTRPRPKGFKVFKLEHAPAFWIVYRLEDYFEDDDAEEDAPWWARDNRQPKDDTRRLSSQRKVKFISDFDTNTVLVQGADTEQLKTIQELIDLYDVPEREDKPTARVTKLFTIKHSRAGLVATTIKDAFRDLLSSNDKALSNPNSGRKKQGGGGGGNGGGNGGGQEPVRTSIFGSSSYLSEFGTDGTQDDEKEAAKRPKVNFKGQLSMGVDEVTNTLLVTTEGADLMKVVDSMIEALDRSAIAVDNVEIVSVGRGVNGLLVQSMLRKMFRKTGPNQGQPQNQQQQQPKQQQPANNARPNRQGSPFGGGSPAPMIIETRLGR